MPSMICTCGHHQNDHHSGKTYCNHCGCCTFGYPSEDDPTIGVIEVPKEDWDAMIANPNPEWLKKAVKGIGNDRTQAQRQDDS